MKIYFSGAQSSGKTTLARYVSKSYKLPMVTETARMVLSEQELQIDTLRYDIDLVDKYEQEVFDRQLKEEEKYLDFVSDRSALDAIAYAGNYSRISSNLINCSQLTDYLVKLKDKDSLIFFVRPTKATLKQDGVREQLSWEGVVTIDAQIKLLLELYKVRYFQISMENMQERVSFIDNIINLFL